jgi:sulfatase modifying factor 1
MKTVSIILALCFSIPCAAQEADEKLKSKLQKKTEKHTDFVRIPAGAFTMGAGEFLGPEVNGNKKPVQKSVESFYMSRVELTNFNYLNYLDSLKRNDKAAYQIALPDTLVWRSKLAYNEPYVEYYFRHPAYRDYPVVGVSHEQAIAYCTWVTEQYNNNSERIFEQVKFRLPTNTEWEYAARGGMELSPYPWGGPYTRNAKGSYLANFKVIPQASIYRDTISCNGMLANFVTGSGSDYIGYAGRLTDAADVTAPVGSYWPNDYGLYNMAGNVEEMVAEQGITRGGSWADTGYYLQNNVEQHYTGATSGSSEIGFRLVFDVVKY